MRRLLTEFVAAQVRRFSFEAVSNLREINPSVNHPGTLAQPKVIIVRLTSLAFLRRSGLYENIVIRHHAVLFETRGLEECIERLKLPGLAPMVFPMNEPFGIVAAVGVVIHSAISGRRAGDQRVSRAAHDKVVAKMAVLPDRRRTKTRAGTARCIVVGQDAGGIVVQLVA